MDAETTVGKQQVGRPFQPGQSGNPSGRPKGSRNRLSESFLSALADDFERDGLAAIQRMRADDPSGYVRVIASVLPKQLRIDDDRRAVTDYSDDELIAIIARAEGREVDQVLAHG